MQDKKGTRMQDKNNKWKQDSMVLKIRDVQNIFVQDKNSFCELSTELL